MLEERERPAPSSLYDQHLGPETESEQGLSSSLEVTDERTEIILAATFLLIVVLAFLAYDIPLYIFIYISYILIAGF